MSAPSNLNNNFNLSFLQKTKKAIDKAAAFGVSKNGFWFILFAAISYILYQNITSESEKYTEICEIEKQRLWRRDSSEIAELRSEIAEFRAFFINK